MQCSRERPQPPSWTGSLVPSAGAGSVSEAAELFRCQIRGRGKAPLGLQLRDGGEFTLLAGSELPLSLVLLALIQIPCAWVKSPPRSWGETPGSDGERQCRAGSCGTENCYPKMSQVCLLGESSLADSKTLLSAREFSGKGGGEMQKYLSSEGSLYVHLIKITTWDQLSSLLARLLACTAKLWQAGRVSFSPGSLKRTISPFKEREVGMESRAEPGSGSTCLLSLGSPTPTSLCGIRHVGSRGAGRV